MNKNKNLGFTLAEVLIVIGIIGVVAALTLPNLNHATGDKEKVTRVMKAYSILNEAHDRAQAIYGPVTEWDCSAYTYGGPFDICWLNRVKEYLKVSKKYCDETSGDSDDSSYLVCDGLSFPFDGLVFQLSDGLTFGTTGSDSCENGPTVSWLGTNKKTCLSVYIDIDGPNKGKNEYGEDVFGFGVTPEGLFPIGENSPESVSDILDYCINTHDDGTPIACAYWVVNYGNLDYLKINEDHKCNDSNIILDGVTNTSCH